jgi:ferredoxin
MALTILADPCAGCGVCGEVCPMSAIHRLDRGTPEIDPARCTECVGHFASPRCASLCRLEAIVPAPHHFESRTTLIRKWHRLTGGGEYGQEPPPRLEQFEETGTGD